MTTEWSLLQIQKTNGQILQMRVPVNYQLLMQSITAGRGSHWSWLGDLIGQHIEAGLIMKIEDVSHMIVSPLRPANATS
jgi:hypothetical protein